IHGIHYWGAQAMIVLVGLHMIRVFIWGAYKRPRELIWLVGVVLLLLTAIMSFTGVLLPWDEVGYFAAKVGTNIAGTFPVIGNWIKKVIIGGTDMGQLTLSRFFIMHVAIIPFILLALIIAHLVAFRQFGSVGPWGKKHKDRSDPFWPDQVFMDILLAMIVLLVLVVLSVYLRAPFSGSADPLDTSYHPKPEWNFLFLYQALKAFKGVWEPAGTIMLPLILVLFLFSVPFIDRYRERNPIRRPAIIILVSVFFFGVLALTIIGKNSVPGIGVVRPSQTKIELPANTTAEIKDGHSLFMSNNCAVCHSINGSGGTVGPDLSHESAKGLSDGWIEQQIRDPKSHFPNSIMPAFTSLTQPQLKLIAEYLLNVDKGFAAIAEEKAPVQNYSNEPLQNSNVRSLTGLAASIIGNPEHGYILFRQQCEGCHGVDGKGGVPNPGSDAGAVPVLNPVSRNFFSNDVMAFVQNIDTVIQHGMVPPGPHPALRMPAFGDSHTLTQQQISQIESYVLSINNVDRAEILNPGIKPQYFAWVSVAVFLILGISLLIYGYFKFKKKSDTG
ncbi:MAG: cytochrome b N-terminal domain-containing protein, partial [Bacteroidales bacterium]